MRILNVALNKMSEIDDLKNIEDQIIIEYIEPSFHIPSTYIHEKIFLNHACKSS